MASATRLPLKTLTTVMAIGLGLSAVKSRELIQNFFVGPGSTSRIIALIVVLANAKNFPFVWHLRVWGAILKHFLFSPRSFTPKLAGLSSEHPALFQHTVTPSRSPIAECDYNLHKSNSTYFSDLDVTRSHLISALLRKGIKSIQDNPGQVIMPDGKPAKGKWFIMLGAVSCSFKREIKPYQPYEMWTRVLCWDRKWVYTLTHFVEAGAVIPTGYTYENGTSALSKLFRKSKQGKKVTQAEKPVANTNSGTIDEKVPHKAIFATAISKYVMKLGRLTIHPEVVLDASSLLPPRPGGWNTMSGTKSKENAGVPTNGQASNATDLKWDWKRIEAENARGMEFAKQFAALDNLHNEFEGDDRPVIGVYPDPFTF